MRVVAVASRTLRWAIAGHGAARGRSERAAIVLEVRTADGGRGLGEAAPLPGMSTDTLDDAARAIAGFAARAPFELGTPADAFAIARAATDAPSARFAIETALLDALARQRGVSLAAVLRDAHAGASAATGASANPGAASAWRADPVAAITKSGAIAEPGAASAWRADPVAAIPLAAVVDDGDAARRAFAAGIRCFKIKVGAADDVARVTAIAAAVPGGRLRLDANRGWPRDEVAARLAALAHLPIDYVEEPCHDAHLLLTAALPCKLALDDSLATLAPDALRAALASPALAALVLKPSVLGGFAAALALADLAHAHGLAAVASHALEGPIGSAACAEFALALGGSAAAGLAPHGGLTGWRLAVPQLAADHVRAARAPGLGFAALDLAAAVAACHGDLREPIA